MKFSTKNKLIVLAFLFVILGSFIALLMPEQDILAVQIFRIALGSVFILFLPGYFLTLAFFREGEIDVLERIALSFALSIAVVPLMTFYTHLAGVPISAMGVYGVTLVIIVLSSLYILISDKKISGISHHRDGQ